MRGAFACPNYQSSEKIPKPTTWRAYGAPTEITLCANKKEVMKHPIALLALNAALLVTMPARAADI